PRRRLADPMMSEPFSVVPATRPYPWPWTGQFAPERTALVVTGVQWVHAEASVDSLDAFAQIDRLRAALVSAAGIVVVVRHLSSGRPRPLLPASRTPEAEWFRPPRTGDLQVTAAGHDAFFGSPLDEVLRGRDIDSLMVVGCAAEVTVSSTVRSANDRGYECLTVEDAAAPLSAKTGSREIHSITMSGGIFGAVGRTDDVLSALARREGDPESERDDRSAR
ncbi:MAG: isochorismatase family protein, partial [Actinomycetota bacterium]